MITCVKCEIELRPLEIGATLASMNVRGEVCELRSCDIWQCPSCGCEIVAGMAGSPFAVGAEDCGKRLMQCRPARVVRSWLNDREKSQGIDHAEWVKGGCN